MSKFANRPANITAPITTTGARTYTHEGGLGHVYDAKSALYLLAVTNMVSEDTFYESGKARDDRFEQLVHAVTAEDPGWVARFIPYLRDTMQMRSASIVAAVEYAKAGGPKPRGVIASALQRGDEPAEMIAYIFSRHGRHLAGGVKRGIADACTRLYTERASLRYDGTDRPWRMGDVIELVHPTPTAPWQSQLFTLLLDKRHHGDLRALEGHSSLLSVIDADIKLRAMPEADRRGALGSGDWLAAGWSWERLSGWLPGGMDAQAWEAVIPQMGYMALLRNLRNFDDAGIAADWQQFVMRKLTDPVEVAKSRQFPFRFYSAYAEVASLKWAGALEAALDFSLANVPVLTGKTLFLIDTSGSMQSAVSGKSKRLRYELAALFGTAVAQASRDSASLVLYADGSEERDDILRMPLLRAIEAVGASIGRVGHATHTFQSLLRHYAGHDRIMIFSDEQAHDAGRYDLPDVPIFTFNLAGYAPGHLPAGERNRYSFGGLTDAAFRLIPALERRDGEWPF